MEALKHFIKLQSQYLQAKNDEVKKLKEPTTPHEYVILNNAWVRGEMNMLDKLKKFVEEYETRN